jgi:hypothetical protein
MVAHRGRGALVGFVEPPGLLDCLAVRSRCLVSPLELRLMNSAISRVSISGCSSTMLWPQSRMPRSQVFARVVAISRPLAGIATRSRSPTITSIGAAPPDIQSSGGVELLALTWALATVGKVPSSTAAVARCSFPGAYISAELSSVHS